MITYVQRVAACRHQIGGRLYNGLNVQIGHVCGRCLQPMPLGPANDRGVPEVEMRLAADIANGHASPHFDRILEHWVSMHVELDGIDRAIRQQRNRRIQPHSTHRAEAMRARRRR